MVFLWIEPDDSTSHLRVVKSLRPDMDELALENVREWRFAPATRAGKPVVSELYVDVSIEIR